MGQKQSVLYIAAKPESSMQVVLPTYEQISKWFGPVVRLNAKGKNADDALENLAAICETRDVPNPREIEGTNDRWSLGYFTINGPNRHVKSSKKNPVHVYIPVFFRVKGRSKCIVEVVLPKKHVVLKKEENMEKVTGPTLQVEHSGGMTKVYNFGGDLIQFSESSNSDSLIIECNERSAEAISI